jgi:hypothetical protein
MKFATSAKVTIMRALTEQGFSLVALRGPVGSNDLGGGNSPAVGTIACVKLGLTATDDAYVYQYGNKRQTGEGFRNERKEDG